MGWFTRLGGAAGIVCAVAVGAAAGDAGNPVEGHRLAVKICSFCHIAAADQEFAPTLHRPGPSFLAIANKPGKTASSLQKFLLTTHSTIAEPKNMPNPRLTDDQVIDIVSYILSLRSGKAGARGVQRGNDLSAPIK